VAKKEIVLRPVARPFRELDMAGKLDSLTEVALDRKMDILGTPLPPDDDDSAEACRMRALILAAADSAINQKIKVDETAMVARRSQELLPELLARIEAALKGG
jgi:hypothetical protein